MFPGERLLLNFLLAAGIGFGSTVSFPLFFEPLAGSNHYLARGKGYQANILPSGIDLEVAQRRIAQARQVQLSDARRDDADCWRSGVFR